MQPWPTPKASPASFPTSPAAPPARGGLSWPWSGHGRKFLIPVVFFAAIFLFAQWKNLRFYNDGDDKAEIEVGGKRITLEPQTWGEITLRTGRDYEAKATFPNGVSKSWSIDLNNRPNYPNVRAYAAAGSGCVALLDVSRMYRAQAPPIKAIATFKHTHVMEARVDGATLLEPGELRKKVYTGRSSKTLLWFRPVSCEDVENDDMLHRFEDSLNRTIED